MSPMLYCLQRSLFSFLKEMEGMFLLLFSLSVVSTSATPWTAAHQASLSFTVSQTLLKLISIESVMPSNCLLLRRSLIFENYFYCFHQCYFGCLVFLTFSLTCHKGAFLEFWGQVEKNEQWKEILDVPLDSKVWKLLDSQSV